MLTFTVNPCTIHNTVLYFAVLLDGTTRIFVQRPTAIKASKHMSNGYTPNSQKKSHYYFKGIELTPVRSDEGINVSKYQYEILPEASVQKRANYSSHCDSNTTI